MIRVVGIPVTQGSKSAGLINGQVRMWEQRGSQLKPWRRAVTDAVTGRYEQPLQGPVAVSLRFLLPYPPSAPKRRRELPWKSRSFDVDKLARAVLDSLTGPVLVDDAQVLGLYVSKAYVEGDVLPGVWIEIVPFAAGDATTTYRWPDGWAP